MRQLVWNELTLHTHYKSSLLQKFFEICALKKFVFTGKHLCWSFFLNKLQVLGNNRNIRKGCEIYSKLTIKTLKRHQWRRSDRSGVFIVNFEHISHSFFFSISIIDFEHVSWVLKSQLITRILIPLEIWHGCFSLHFSHSR